MKFKSIFFACLLLVAFSNCELQQFEQDVLDNHREIWKGHNINDYTFTFGEVCDCSQTEDIEVVVVADQVVSATYNPSGIEITESDLDNVRNIDEVFDIIQEAINDGYYFINIEYHDEYGYPAIFEIDPDGGVEGDNVVYSIRDFEF